MKKFVCLLVIACGSTVPCLAGVGVSVAKILTRVGVRRAVAMAESDKPEKKPDEPDKKPDRRFSDSMKTKCKAIGELRRDLNWTPISLDLWDSEMTHWSIPWREVNVYGLDLGLFSSFCDEFAGVQANPFLVHTWRANGLQGPALIARTDFVGNGVFVGGLCSAVGRLRGLQLSCGMAFSVESVGCQLAPVNRAYLAMYGVQLGLWNSCKSGCGLQLGCVNSCDRLDGVQVGIVNRVVKSGTCVQLGLVNIVRSRVGFPIVNLEW